MLGYSVSSLHLHAARRVSRRCTALKYIPLLRVMWRSADYRFFSFSTTGPFLLRT